jgi:hypothetical protein
MPKKSILIIIGITLFSFILVAVLYAISEEGFSYRHDFSRVHRDNIVALQDSIDLGGNNYYLAGATRDAIYFGDHSDSLALVVTDGRLKNAKRIGLTIYGEDIPALTGARIHVDSPFFYIKAGAFPGVFKGHIGEWKAQRIRDSIPYFVQAVPTGSGPIAFQAEGGTVNQKTRHNIIGMARSGREVKLKTDLLEGQGDNYYNTLVILRYSKTLNQFVYMYTYRDEYLILDTALNLLHKGISIGTVSRAYIKPIEVEEGVYTLASISALVNRGAQVYDNLLFVISNLKAENEIREDFDKALPVDVYNLITQQYVFSFYLNDYKGIKLNSIHVYAGGVVALHGHHVVHYSFDENIVKNLLIQ